jgi:membrane-bound lytic murein transglycosylase A
VRLLSRAITLASLVLLAACATKPAPPPEVAAPPTAPTTSPQPAPVPPPAPPIGRNAVATGVSIQPPRTLPQDVAARALNAFRLSCAAVISRTDASGLTVGADWQGVCAQAASLDPTFAPGFFYYGFDWVKVGEGKAFMTGYYEPEIEGSRVPLPGYVPIYRVPPDLIRCTQPNGSAGRRIDQTGACTLYYTRADIEDGALANKGLELAWAKDNLDLFFVEIQGSGRIRFEDGSVMRIAYANQNGRDYVAIGRLLRDRGILPPGGATMQSIRDWIRANPEQGRALMRENLSYIFFKELIGPGPPGALNVPVTPRATVAADPNYVPLGAPVYIHRADRHEVDGLWVAQDVGGAIKGPNRFDTFWGSGSEAAAIAGGMSATGEALILVPKGIAARALAQP